MANDLDDLLGPESSEPNTSMVGIAASVSLVKRYQEVSRLTKEVFGRNRVPTIARARISALLDEIEFATLQKLKEREDKTA